MYQAKPAGYGRVIPLTEKAATKQFLRLMTALNRKAYGRRFKRGEVRLAGIPCVEFGINGDNIHIHAAVEIPPGWTKTSLAAWIGKRWRSRSHRVGGEDRAFRRNLRCQGLAWIHE